MRTTIVLLFAGIALLLQVNSACSQYNWAKSNSNPLIGLGLEPSVIYDSTQKLFKIWYASTTDLSIRYAVSFDGKQWLSYPYGSVVAPGQTGSIDEGGIYSVSVMLVQGTYYMYYTARGVINGGYDTVRICAATSSNGIDWKKYDANPVLSAGMKGSWEESGVGGPHVLYQGGTFHMIYGAVDSISHGRTGYATSQDGFHWTKCSKNPVLAGDSAGWDAGYSSAAGLTKKDSVYYLMYGGTTILGGPTQLGIATSTDLQTWVKPYNHPVILFGGSGQWDHSWLGGGALLYVNGMFSYWYSGNGPSGWSIGYASSESGPLSVGLSPLVIPERSELEQNYPNPFNPSTHIEFVMPAAGRAILKVFDLRGAEVATLVDATLPMGRHAYQWDAQGMSSGVYFYRLQAAGVSESRKMIVLK